MRREKWPWVFWRILNQWLLMYRVLLWLNTVRQKGPEFTGTELQGLWRHLHQKEQTVPISPHPVCLLNLEECLQPQAPSTTHRTNLVAVWHRAGTIYPFLQLDSTGVFMQVTLCGRKALPWTKSRTKKKMTPALHTTLVSQARYNQVWEGMWPSGHL